MAARRHLDDLARSKSDAEYRWKFDTEKVERVCRFIESLTLKDDVPFILQDFQVWLVASLMGWVDSEGIRKHIEALILIPKGNGKSPLAAALALWFAFLDGVSKAEVFCGAKSLAQAKEVFNPAYDFVTTQPAFARLGVVAQKTSIYSTRSGGTFKPVIGKGRHGARPYLAILDELHQATTPDLYDTFKTGCNKVVNSLMLTISTAGVASKDNVCYALQAEVEKVLQGIIPNERIFGAIFCADETVDWFSDEALRMGNPNLGISNDAEKIRLAIKEAVTNPAKQNNVKAMHLNQWSTAASSWMNMQAWQECYDPELNDGTVSDLPGWIGTDLASHIDLSAMVRVFRDDSKGEKPHYYVFCRAYLPQSRVDLPENQHYQKWAKQGFLTATTGSSIDYSVLEADALTDIAKYQIKDLPYDARYADQWSQRVSELSGIERVETPPSPAVLSPAIKELEAAVYDGRVHHDNHPVLQFCMSNVLTRETALGNMTMPDKPKPESKIDAAIALFIAMTRAMVYVETPDDSGYQYFMTA